MSRPVSAGLGRRRAEPGRKGRSTERPFHIHGPDHHRPVVHNQRHPRNANRRTPQETLPGTPPRPTRPPWTCSTPPAKTLSTHRNSTTTLGHATSEQNANQQVSPQLSTGCLITPKVECRDVGNKGPAQGPAATEIPDLVEPTSRIPIFQPGSDLTGLVAAWKAAFGELPAGFVPVVTPATRSRLSARGFSSPKTSKCSFSLSDGCAPARDGTAKTGGGPLEMVTNGRLG